MLLQIDAHIDIDILQRICSRAVLVKAVYELIATSSQSVEHLASIVTTQPYNPTTFSTTFSTTCSTSHSSTTLSTERSSQDTSNIRRKAEEGVSGLYSSTIPSTSSWALTTETLNGSISNDAKESIRNQFKALGLQGSVLYLPLRTYLFPLATLY